MGRGQKEKLLTVAEFSKAANISRQSVYKKVDNSLQKYVVRVDNRIMLKIQGLEEFSKDKNCQPVDNQVDKNCQPVDKKIIDLLTKELEEKNSQLKAKDQQIATLEKLLDQEQQLRFLVETKMLEVKESDPEEKKTFWERVKQKMRLQ